MILKWAHKQMNINLNKGGINITAARIPAGQRVYAIGDVHGRLDLLGALAMAIEQHDTQAPAALSRVILLGDLIDRGPDSKGVIDFVRTWQQQRPLDVLMGNHEEMFLAAFTNVDYLERLLPHGALETLDSYGIAVPDTQPATLRQVQSHMAEAIPPDHRHFMAGTIPTLIIGDYQFVHAGVEPDVPLARQADRPMRWIREPFLSHTELYERVIVHGHTIRPEIEERANRIGIDTGAYCYDVLTALVLEGGTRSFLQARGSGEAIAIEQRDAAH